MTKAVTHYCEDGTVARLQAEWDEDSEEYRTECYNCGASVYANEEGIEHP